MARCRNLPYKPQNPRSVRGAVKRGWHVVEVDLRKRDASWMVLCLWAERGLDGYWVASLWLQKFAFESGADAMAFKLKWS